MVEVNISHESEGFFYVRPIGSNKPPIMATIHDLVIRRKRY
jgi:hypothetical protein